MLGGRARGARGRAAVFGNLSTLIAAHEGAIEARPPSRLAHARSIKNRQDIIGEAAVRCVRKMGQYCKELESRGYETPMKIRYWPGPVPWLDLQVLEVAAGRKRLQLRTEDDLVLVSALLREELEKARSAPA